MLPDYTSGYIPSIRRCLAFIFPSTLPQLSVKLPASLLIPYFFFTTLQLGFVPRTLCPDGDPIDVLVLSKFPLTPGIVAECRLIGVMDMEDEKGGDAKLIAVVATEPRTHSMLDIGDVPAHVKAEIQQFFELYKSLEAKPGRRLKYYV